MKIGAPKESASGENRVAMTPQSPAPGQHLAYDERPDWFKNWETTGLLGFDYKAQGATRQV